MESGYDVVYEYETATELHVNTITHTEWATETETKTQTKIIMQPTKVTDTMWATETHTVFHAGTETATVTYVPPELPIQACQADTCMEWSFIIVSYNEQVTRNTLRGLMNTVPGNVSCEYVVVDNRERQASPFQLLMPSSEHPHIRIIPAKRKVSRSKAINMGVEAAKGRYISMVSSNARLSEDWIEKTLTLFRAHNDVGMVTPLIKDKQGWVVEAGGVLYQDGSSATAAKDPYRHVESIYTGYNYVRQVDFASHRAFTVRKDYYVGVGGMNETIDIAQVGMLDLSLRMTKHKYRIMYQPNVQVTIPEVKRVNIFQETADFKKFLSMWEDDALTNQPVATMQYDLAKDHLSPGPKFLFIADHAPNPYRTNSSEDDQAVLLFKGLVNRGARPVLVLTTPRPKHTTTSSSGLRKFVNTPIRHSVGDISKADVEDVELDSSEFMKQRTLQNDVLVLTNLGVEVLILSVEQFSTYLKDTAIGGKDGQYDCAGVGAVVIGADYASNDQYLATISKECSLASKNHPKIVVNLAGQSSVLETLYTKRLIINDRVPDSRKEQLASLKSYHHVLVPSSSELSRLMEHLPNIKASVCSEVFPIRDSMAVFSAREGVLLMGKYDAARVETLEKMFIRNVWHQFQKDATGDVPIYVVIRGSKVQFSNNNSDKLIFIRENDLAMFYAKVRVAVIPGLGVEDFTTTSVMEAMSNGVPVVVNNFHPSSDFIENDVNGYVATNPEDMSSKLLRLYETESVWRSNVAGGFKTLKRNYSNSSVKKCLTELLNMVVDTS
eukprot:CFRG1560T1